MNVNFRYVLFYSPTFKLKTFFILYLVLLLDGIDSYGRPLPPVRKSAHVTQKLSSVNLLSNSLISGIETD